MIAETELEYETELDVYYYNRHALVTVNIINDTLLSNEFYLIVVERAEKVFSGVGTNANSYKFPQVPCTEIVFHAFKLHVGTLIKVISYGYTIDTISKDTEINISMSNANVDTTFNKLNLVINDLSIEVFSRSLGLSLTVT